MQSLGPELAVNGGFDTDTIWTKQAGWTISGGVAVGTNASGSTIYKTGVLTSGKKYQVTFTIVTCTSGGVKAQCGNQVGVLRTTPGTYTDQIVSDGDLYGVNANNSFNGTIDNFSVKLIANNFFSGQQSLNNLNS